MKTLSQRINDWLTDQFEISRGQTKAILSMEGIRGLAVIMVFFAHYAVLIHPWINANGVTALIGDELRSIGHAGVDLFFVLSGYLIYSAMIRKHRPLGEFLGRRLLRIYPTFLFVFMIYLGLSLAFPAYSKFPLDAREGGVYLIQNLLLLPGMIQVEPVMVVAWSLSYEFFYYLTIPVLIFATAMRSWKPADRLRFFSVLAAAGFLYCSFHHGHIRLLMFVSGILLYEIREQKLMQARKWSGLIALGCACVIMVVTKHLELKGFVRYSALFVCFGWLCLDCFNNKTGTAQLFSWTPLRWFGNISYSYYLIHSLVLKAAFLVLYKIYPPTGADDHLFWTLMPVMFGATVFVSAGLYILVEKPLSLPAASSPVKDAETLVTPAPRPTFSFARVFVLHLRYANSWVALSALMIGKESLVKWLRGLLAVLVPLGMGMSA